MRNSQKTIRQLIPEMQKVGSSALFFYEHKEPIRIFCGKATDVYGLDTFSKWKSINGRPVCRKIHCIIPKEFYDIAGITVYKKYMLDEWDDDVARECIISERRMNEILSCLRLDHYRNIGEHYYAMVDSMDAR